MKNGAYLAALAVFMAGCFNKVPNDYRPALSYTPLSSEGIGMSSEYRRLCDAAMAGDYRSLVLFLEHDDRLDGESAYIHGFNLLALKNGQPINFRMAMRSLDAKRARKIDAQIVGAAEDLRMMKIRRDAVTQ